MMNDPDAKQAEIKRIEAAVKDMAKLMNGSFELDRSKLQAFSADGPRSEAQQRSTREEST
jgi:hypothetical protein